MKATIVSLLIPLSLFLCSADSSALVQKSGSTPRVDVLEHAASAAVPQGFADLIIFASLKTHNPGLFTATDPHGTPAYRLQLVIDGQVLVMEGALQSENLAVNGAGDPEAGSGIRYRFRKVVRLKEGPHRIEVSLPAENIVLAKEITLQEGQENRLVLEPVYGRVLEKKRPSANKVTGFQEGINRIIMSLNGQRI